MSEVLLFVLSLWYVKSKLIEIMGATTFEIKYRANSLSEAYNNASSDAREEYGNDSYNGTISTTSGVKDVTNEFKRSGLSLSKFVDKNIDRAEKWGNCLGICIKKPKANPNKVKSKVEHVVSKGARKWETRYVVSTWDKEIGYKLTKGDAVKMARKHTEQTEERTYVDIEKHLVRGESRVAKIHYKESSKQALGEYYLFGWAAE
jgi:hypothetical protein